jgi:glycosyltransferase involved in cell wall biosynthesis
MGNKTILTTCYAVNPYKGSEDGMGWNFVLQIARFNNVYAITRKNNKIHIDNFMKENPSELYENINFLYFDLPYWMRFWKKGSFASLIYFNLWQRNIITFIKKQNITYDIVHNLNFHNDWTPSFLHLLNKPFVWGPIGHHSKIPKQFIKKYSFKYSVKENFTWLIKKMFWKYSTALNITIKNADYILCMNNNVKNVLPIENKNHSIMPSVGTEDFYKKTNSNKEHFNVISVGRFIPLKGFDLTILSFVQFINSLPSNESTKCKLTIVGAGPEKKKYINLIKKYKAENNVEIIEWMDRVALMNLYNNASVFLFPSHEGAGMVVAEALSFGLPVICLDNDGPGEFINTTCGFAIKKTNYITTISKLSEALNKLYSNKDILMDMSEKARIHYENTFTWDSKGNQLNDIYNQIKL